MKYYKATISIQNGLIIYGNLPSNFVLGYEDKEMGIVYFELHDSVDLPEGTIDVVVIEKEEYDAGVKNLINKEREQKALEQEQLINQMIQQKQIKEDQLNSLSQSQKSADQKYKELDIDTTPLVDYQNAKIAQLKEKCNQSIETGFLSPSMGYFFGFKAHDQNNFKGQAIVFLTDPSETQCEWKTEDAGVVMIQKDDFIKLIPEGKEHTRKNTEKYWGLVNQVSDAKTNLAVSEINWN